MDAIPDPAIPDPAIPDPAIPDPSDRDTPTHHDSLGFDRWRKRSATGAVMTGIALGLQAALEPPKHETAIVVQAAGDPPGPPGPIDLRFDPDDPAGTVAVIRPWLGGDDSGDSGGDRGDDNGDR